MVAYLLQWQRINTHTDSLGQMISSLKWCHFKTLSYQIVNCEFYRQVFHVLNSRKFFGLLNCVFVCRCKSVARETLETSNFAHVWNENNMKKGWKTTKKAATTTISSSGWMKRYVDLLLAVHLSSYIRSNFFAVLSAFCVSLVYLSKTLRLVGSIESIFFFHFAISKTLLMWTRARRFFFFTRRCFIFVALLSAKVRTNRFIYVY